MNNGQVTGSSGFSISGSYSNYARYGSEAPFFAFSDTVNFIKTGFYDFNVADSNGRIDSLCPNNNMIIGFSDGQTDAIEFVGTTL